MSQAYRADQVIRCPLFRTPATPAHVGNGVHVCEECWEYLRVIHATPGRTR